MSLFIINEKKDELVVECRLVIVWSQQKVGSPLSGHNSISSPMPGHSRVDLPLPGHSSLDEIVRLRDWS